MNLKKEINKDEIESLIPHRKPFLLIDKLTDIVPLMVIFQDSLLCREF
jgi:3-hydroxymyristoyl/3-hydroxydecanoyl-(acyl carrier protein) dehydratase